MPEFLLFYSHSCKACLNRSSCRSRPQWAVSSPAVVLPSPYPARPSTCRQLAFSRSSPNSRFVQCRNFFFFIHTVARLALIALLVVHVRSGQCRRRLWCCRAHIQRDLPRAVSLLSPGRHLTLALYNAGISSFLFTQLQGLP